MFRAFRFGIDVEAAVSLPDTPTNCTGLLAPSECPQWVKSGHWGYPDHRVGLAVLRVAGVRVLAQTTACN